MRESLNDPVADARQAAILFADEFQSLAGLLQTDKRVFDVLHFLLATGDGEAGPLANGMAMVFRALGVFPPSQQEALLLSRELVSRWACSSATIDERLFRTQSSRLAMAYALTWLRVAGGNSVLPPWVRHQYPETGELLTRLREVPCNADTCTYCRQFHNPTGLLREFFKYDAFRAKPAGRSGGSLQQEIVEAGMRNESLLAILPTGGGKSLCYQVPALARNRRRGVLTIILSPLQALMKDQVDGLVRRTETSSAAALFGLLTQPERSDVLRRIRLGDIALLYVSPEQLRNRSFEAAIKEREIGCWVFAKHIAFPSGDTISGRITFTPAGSSGSSQKDRGARSPRLPVSPQQQKRTWSTRSWHSSRPKLAAISLFTKAAWRGRTCTTTFNR